MKTMNSLMLAISVLLTSAMASAQNHQLAKQKSQHDLLRITRATLVQNQQGQSVMEYEFMAPRSKVLDSISIYTNFAKREKIDIAVSQLPHFRDQRVEVKLITSGGSGKVNLYAVKLLVNQAKLGPHALTLHGQGKSTSVIFELEKIDLKNRNISLYGANMENSCTCYGGPGNYPYQCAPVQKTCHGGPGMYPYTCYVCPN